MRVLTYVDGIITVINEDKFFRGEYEKPSFIGANFYYEPTQKITLGRELTVQECSEAENYINNFMFPSEVVYIPQEVHTVDKWGNYLGIKVPLDNEFEVTEPPREGQGITWNFTTNEWYESVLVDATTGELRGSGINTSIDNSVYVPAELVDTELCFKSQTYNFNTKVFDINIDTVKNSKTQYIIYQARLEFNKHIGQLSVGEIVSWDKQLSEATAFSSDNTSSTPFLDTLLSARNIDGETKAILVEKILAKADAYTTWYASHLGKVQNLEKVIEAATTVDELKAISW